MLKKVWEAVKAPPSPDRNYGIDLLRLVSMLMVITLHTLGHGGVLGMSGDKPVNYAIAWLFEILAYAAVNIFVMITGYAYARSRYRFSGLFVMWLQVLFYSVGVYLYITRVYKPFLFDTKELGQWFTPLLGNKYWFFTAYFALSAIIPVLSAAVRHLTEKQLRLVLAACFVVSLPAMWGRDLFHMQNGYSMAWFVILFLIGSYLRLYGDKLCLCRWKCIVMFFVSCLVTWGVKMLIDAKGIPTAFSLVSYMAPTIVLAAVAMVMLFSQMKFPAVIAKLIGQFAPAAFGVYLIHEHPLFREHFIKDQFAFFGIMAPGKMIWKIVSTVLSIFLFCLAVDWIRCKLFDLLHIKKLCGRLEKKLVGDAFNIQ